MIEYAKFIVKTGACNEIYQPPSFARFHKKIVSPLYECMHCNKWLSLSETTQLDSFQCDLGDKSYKASCRSTKEFRRAHQETAKNTKVTKKV